MKMQHRWGDLGDGVGLRPSERLEEDLFQFAITGPNVPFDQLLSDRDALFKYIAENVPDTKLEFDELVFVDDWRPNIRMANKFSEGRVFIIGDAAHVHCTTGGQGVVSCLQDSNWKLNLGWKLALVEQGLAHKNLLSSYHEERHPVISDMLQLTTSLFDGAITGRLMPWQKIMQKLRQFGVNYRWSSIVLDGSVRDSSKSVGTYDAVGVPLCAGDRAPEAPGLVDAGTQDVTSIFAILSCARHAMFVLADSVDSAMPFFNLTNNWAGAWSKVLILPASHQIAFKDSIPGVRVLIDREGHAFHTYSVNGSRKAVVVRPDGIVGALTNQSSDLERYYNMIFAISM